MYVERRSRTPRFYLRKTGSLKELKENTSPLTLTHPQNRHCSHSLRPPHSQPQEPQRRSTPHPRRPDLEIEILRRTIVASHSLRPPHCTKTFHHFQTHTTERECCLLVLNLVSSILSCIRQSGCVMTCKLTFWSRRLVLSRHAEGGSYFSEVLLAFLITSRKLSDSSLWNDTPSAQQKFAMASSHS
jgi:hypothetical protein